MIIEGYDISLLYMYNREEEEGITLSSTPAGYVYIPLFPARRAAANIPVLTSEDNNILISSLPRRGT